MGTCWTYNVTPDTPKLSFKVQIKYPYIVVLLGLSFTQFLDEDIVGTAISARCAHSRQLPSGVTAKGDICAQHSRTWHLLQHVMRIQKMKELLIRSGFLIKVVEDCVLAKMLHEIEVFIRSVREGEDVMLYFE